jgi:hypothetical protein
MLFAFHSTVIACLSALQPKELRKLHTPENKGCERFDGVVDRGGSARITPMRFALCSLFGFVVCVSCAPIVDPVAASSGALEVVCVPPGGAPAGAFVCGATLVTECVSPTGAVGPTLYVTPTTSTCSDVTLRASSLGPFSLGPHDVVVTAASSTGTTEVCRARLVVADTQAPTLRDRVPSLWPPNHRFHRITPADCAAVTDRCDASVRMTFTSVGSDEPMNATGDGNTPNDVRAFGCDSVEVLAERRGNRDGRVYTLGVRAVDGSGNVTTGVCHVVVAHDQSGRPTVMNAPAWRIAAPTTCP